MAVASEVLEAHGGAGYIEDTGLPLLLRDSQVMPIWEGTTNVLALDALRAIGRDMTGVLALQRKVANAATVARDPALAEAAGVAAHAVHQALHWLQAHAADRPALEAGARRFAMTLGRGLALALLVEQAQWSLDNEHDGRTRAAAVRFSRGRIDLIAGSDMADDAALANDEPLAP